MLTFNDMDKAIKILNDEDKCINISLLDLKLVAKYYDAKGMDIKSSLKKYIIKKLYSYNENKYDEYIDKCVKYCNKYKMMNNHKIPITKKENETLKEIKDDSCRRLMFVMLMYAKHCKINSIHKDNNSKVDSNDLYFSFQTRDLFRFAKVPYKDVVSNSKLLGDLERIGLVEWGFGNWCKILFYDKDDEDFVHEFNANDNILEYIIGMEDKYKSKICYDCNDWFHVVKRNKNSVRCQKCQKQFNKTSNIISAKTSLIKNKK